MKTTLKDLLHAINILGDDRDVTVDGVDTIAVCPPVKITPEGQKHFQEALEATVRVDYKDDSHWGTYVSNDDEELDQKAWELLASLAGLYCDEDEYNKWFEADNAEMI